jgi:uncharacterized YccA/Bax inhibitor family protein
MEWVPTTFIVFKVLVLGIGMFFAVKWHYDQGKKKDGRARQRAVLRAGLKVAGIFLLLLVVLLLATFGLGRALGLNLNFP